jgi:hypothetical protein
MRPIAILVLLLGLAVCPLGASAAAPADCRPAGAPAATADRPPGPACGDANLTPRRPGFWTLEDAAGRDRPDLQPTVLRGGDAGAASGCFSYPLPVVVGGQPLQATIVACPQADGSWQVSQYTPGLPPQVYWEPAPPEAAASAEDYGYPESYPDFADWPWFSGFAPAIASARKFHPLSRPFDHRFTAAPGQRSGRVFGHGLAHGFGRGGGVAGAAAMHR